MISFETIEQRQDRSWSLKLVEMIASETTDDSTAEKILDLLTTLDDPRTIKPLTLIIEDKGKPTICRVRAGKVLSSCYNHAPSFEKRQQWLASGDDILIDQAIANAERCESELMLSIVSDATSTFLITALERLTYGFDEPVFQKAKIATLSHVRADVRKAAANSLYSDQPVVAEAGLISAIDDPSEDVAIAAIESLMYYFSQRAFLFLHEVAARPARSDTFAKRAVGAYEFIRGEFQDSLQFPFDASAAGIAKYVQWLEPVSHLLDIKIKITESPDAQAQTSRCNEFEKIIVGWQDGIVISVSEICSQFEPSDGEWTDKKKLFRSINWSVFSAIEKQSLALYLTKHSDSWIRYSAVDTIAAWHDVPRLAELMEDPVASVRERAIYLSQFLPQDDRLARCLLRLLPVTRGWSCREIIDAYVVHAASDSLDNVLYDLAFSEREEIAYGCVSALSKRNAHEQLDRLTPLLLREPLNWGLQIVLLDAFQKNGITAAIPDYFFTADDLHLQRTLALLKHIE